MVDRFSKVPVKYTLNEIISIAKQLSYAFGLMRTKGYIHNDIKPENILLDMDESKVIYPVICDFGLVHVLNSAGIVQGFKLKNLKAGTVQYCAPEVLNGVSNENRVSNYKTDVYSLGIVFLELFTRKNAWEEFKFEIVSKGGLPVISFKRFVQTFPGVPEEIIYMVMRLILDCIDFDPSRRPLMDDVVKTCVHIENSLPLLSNRIK